MRTVTLLHPAISKALTLWPAQAWTWPPSDNWTLTNTTTSNYTVLAEARCRARLRLDPLDVVQPEPVIQVTPSAQTLCSGETTNINLSVNTSGRPELDHRHGRREFDLFCHTRSRHVDSGHRPMRAPPTAW